MNTFSSHTTARTYQRSIYSCAAVLHDRAHWETFNNNDLRDYLADGVEKAVPQLERIAYLDYPYTKDDEQQLVFMIEALLHARRAADNLVYTR